MVRDRPADESPGGCSDAELLGRHVRGDATAFGELVRRHQDRAWRVAVRMLDHPSDAEDAVQEAFIKAMRFADRFRGESTVSTWLHRIVVNACLDRLRRTAARPQTALELVPDRALPTSPDPYRSKDVQLDLSAALARLPEPQRTAVVLVELEGLTVAEVATLLGVAEGTVKSRCSRGRAGLARLLSSRRNDQAGQRVSPAGTPTGETEPS